jgi:protein-S-isoprenylcysteine O-methyltransferase Ste14
MRLPAYLIAASGLLLAIFIIFRVFVRRSYRTNGRLTPLSMLLEYVAILLWVVFASVNRPADWPVTHGGPVVILFGWILFAGGWIGFLASMVGLGIRRSHGLQADTLRRNGPYGLTRNPQIVAFMLAMLGYLVLWPTWRNAGSLLLMGLLAHAMVMTEEEHLANVFGPDYERYREQVPRYIPLRLGPKE